MPGWLLLIADVVRGSGAAFDVDCFEISRPVSFKGWRQDQRVREDAGGGAVPTVGGEYSGMCPGDRMAV